MWLINGPEPILLMLMSIPFKPYTFQNFFSSLLKTF